VFGEAAIAERRAAWCRDGGGSWSLPCVRDDAFPQGQVGGRNHLLDCIRRCCDQVEHASHSGLVLHGFRHVDLLDLFRIGQVRDGARDAKDAMIRAGAEAEALDRIPK